MPMRVIAALAFVLLPFARVSADMVAPGHKFIVVEVELDFGPLADSSARRVTTLEGDTLEKVAERELGEAERWREIQDMNPDASGDALQPGQTLWVPARASASTVDAVGHHWWHIYACPWMGREDFQRIADGDRIPRTHYGTDIFAVRSDVWREFNQSLTRQPEGERSGLSKGLLVEAALEAWQGQDGFARIGERLGRSGVVYARSEVAQRVEMWRIEAISGPHIDVREVRSEMYDARGQLVEGSLWPLNRNLVPLVVGLFALSALVFRARRRMTSSPKTQ